jgi:hypothetical protein
MAEDDVNLGQMPDLATPWCLRAAATLRIPEHIAAGHRDIGELAAVTGCDRDALHALLGYLVDPETSRPTRVLATITDPEGNPIGLAGHTVPR